MKLTEKRFIHENRFRAFLSIEIYTLDRNMIAPSITGLVPSGFMRFKLKDPHGQEIFLVNDNNNSNRNHVHL